MAILCLEKEFIKFILSASLTLVYKVYSNPHFLILETETLIISIVQLYFQLFNQERINKTKPYKLNPPQGGSDKPYKHS